MVGACGPLFGAPFPSLGTAWFVVGWVLVAASVAIFFLLSFRFRFLVPGSSDLRGVEEGLCSTWTLFRRHGCAATCVLVRSFDVGGRSTLPLAPPAAHLDPPIHIGAGGWEAPPEGSSAGAVGRREKRWGGGGREGGEKDAVGGGRCSSARDARMGGEGKETDRERGG